MMQMKLLTEQKKTQRLRRWLLGGGEGWGDGIAKESGMVIYTLYILNG